MRAKMDIRVSMMMEMKQINTYQYRSTSHTQL